MLIFNSVTFFLPGRVRHSWRGRRQPLHGVDRHSPDGKIRTKDPAFGNPRANPTIASCNASVVNFYNATGSLARFENKKYFILL
jgi:hypothetical protein